ncbi:MAG: four helix bundle protein [Dehalococcoidia bacterium]|nr:four helix bundle protein [Dehalococcoidia bacterium]
MVDRFEDIIAWQRARELTRRVYEITQTGTLGRDWGLANQLQRASVSVMANIAEGFERNRAGEFHQALSVAKGSCAEVRSHLYVALDAGHIGKDEFDELQRIAGEVSRLVGGLRASIDRRRDRGGPDT